MIDQIQELIEWLSKSRPKPAPYRVTDTKRYFRIEHGRSWGAFCFIPKEDFETKATGPMKRGGLYMPATFDRPAKHARGDLLNKSSWDMAFGEWGMRYLR